MTCTQDNMHNLIVDEQFAEALTLTFQYCDSMVRLLTTISLVMASYSEGYHENSIVMKLANSVLSGGKYLLDPELRAEKVCSQSQHVIPLLPYNGYQVY